MFPDAERRVEKQPPFRRSRPGHMAELGLSVGALTQPGPTCLLRPRRGARLKAAQRNGIGKAEDARTASVARTLAPSTGTKPITAASARLRREG